MDVVQVNAHQVERFVGGELSPSDVCGALESARVRACACERPSPRSRCGTPGIKTLAIYMTRGRIHPSRRRSQNYVRASFADSSGNGASFEKRISRCDTQFNRTPNY